MPQSWNESRTQSSLPVRLMRQAGAWLPSTVTIAARAA